MIRIDTGKWFRQKARRRFRDGKPAIAIGIELFEHARAGRLGIDLESAAGVRVTADPSLRLRPAQHG